MLSDSLIALDIQSDFIGINPKPNCIQPASIDLRLGSIIKFPITTDTSCVNPLDKSTFPQYTEMDLSREDVVLASHGFALASTHEKVSLPNDTAARVEGRSTLARLGLLVHLTAGFIDPGFKGNITLELFNAANYPILLTPLMPIAQICFIPMVGEVINPYGSERAQSKYQGSSGTVTPKPLRML